MNPRLLQLLKDYFSAGLEMNLEEIDKLYAPDFLNIRTDLKGNVQQITKANFMQEFQAYKQRGESMPPVDDVQILATTEFGSCGLILFKRTKQGKRIFYNFMWDLTSPKPRLVREFTIEAS